MMPLVESLKTPAVGDELLRQNAAHPGLADDALVAATMAALPSGFASVAHARDVLKRLVDGGIIVRLR
ncbi:MAG: hypothetical protein NTW87_07890 [Planctomycetota bacterium]|nr:hypothetical protein [Planctomycetota bacterium]